MHVENKMSQLTINMRYFSMYPDAIYSNLVISQTLYFVLAVRIMDNCIELL